MMKGRIQKDLYHLVSYQRSVRYRLTQCVIDCFHPCSLHPESRIRPATTSSRGFRSTALKRNDVNDVEYILKQFQDKTIDIKSTQTLLQNLLSNNRPLSSVSDELLQSFATLDHERSNRTGFPEVIFGQGKTAKQVASILEDMARNVNEMMLKDETRTKSTCVSRTILATRISQDVFDELSRTNFAHGSITYFSNAKIVSMKANSVSGTELISNDDNRVVVVTAGTTDIPVSEEAAITLEAAGCTVDRINDCGVAGLHRIIRAIPRLTDPRVRCIIVCAGMDGALPSVVGGLVKVPVIAVPTSIGYGASFGGISAMLTMLNSCSPGVAVMNIDNGFGAAAFAYKCIQ